VAWSQIEKMPKDTDNVWRESCLDDRDGSEGSFLSSPGEMVVHESSSLQA
jgi:hypothetical protein